jgi:Glycosyl transferase family 90
MASITDPIRTEWLRIALGHYLKKYMRRADIRLERVDLGFSAELAPHRDVRIERTARGVTVVFQRSAEAGFIINNRYFLAAYLYQLLIADPSAQYITTNNSDGDKSTLARFTPSSRFERCVPLPDPAFFRNRGYAGAHQQAESTKIAWQERSGDLVWRGGWNGHGRLAHDPEDMFDPAVLQRLRMAMLLRSVPDTDVKLTHLPEIDFGTTPYARQIGLVGDKVPEMSWLGRKYAIDIDGFSNTWGNLLIRMAYGCCVLKVGSQFGYRQWYYDRLKPWEHYVPVKADMSDFAEKIEWVRTNDAEAKAIAERGQALAKSMTFAGEMAVGARLIETHWNT